MFGLAMLRRIFFSFFDAGTVRERFYWRPLTYRRHVMWCALVGFQLRIREALDMKMKSRTTCLACRGPLLCCVWKCRIVFFCLYIGLLTEALSRRTGMGTFDICQEKSVRIGEVFHSCDCAVFLKEKKLAKTIESREQTVFLSDAHHWTNSKVPTKYQCSSRAQQDERSASGRKREQSQPRTGDFLGRPVHTP